MRNYRNEHSSIRYCRFSGALLTSLLLVACGGGGGGSDDGIVAVDTGTSTEPNPDALDISNSIFSEISADCADYANSYAAFVLDIQRSMSFGGQVDISATADSCTLVSNSIPNHDFNDATAHFATNVSEVGKTLTVPRSPVLAAATTALSQRTFNGVMLNGVVLDILSAGCYSPSDAMADADGNVAIGCFGDDPWLLDPLGTSHKFGADAHNAHTQPDGLYHYHGSPEAMFDTNPGPDGSPVIGFAADGFPIYGSYFYDINSGEVRKAVSGYTLKSGTRPVSATDPGGSYDGSYVEDYEFTDSGDLDTCNGMTVNGQYGYYVTDSYPWVIACFSGTPDESFNKN